MTFASWRCSPINEIVGIISSKDSSNHFINHSHHSIDLTENDHSNEKYYVFGELIDFEEDNNIEFKSLQSSDIPLARILIYAHKLIPAFLNGDGGKV